LSDVRYVVYSVWFRVPFQLKATVEGVYSKAQSGAHVHVSESRKGSLRYLIGVNIDPWTAPEIRTISRNAGLGSHITGKSHVGYLKRTNGFAAAFKSDGRIVENRGDIGGGLPTISQYWMHSYLSVRN
jgi:hypothetical protein